MNTERIRALNDAFRRTFSGGKVVMTAGVAALPEMVRANALVEVARFDQFTADNDPYGDRASRQPFISKGPVQKPAASGGS